jgi:hypothetical protein
VSTRGPFKSNLKLTEKLETNLPGRLAGGPESAFLNDLFFERLQLMQHLSDHILLLFGTVEPFSQILLHLKQKR